MPMRTFGCAQDDSGLGGLMAAAASANAGPSAALRMTDLRGGLMETGSSKVLMQVLRLRSG